MAASKKRADILFAREKHRLHEWELEQNGESKLRIHCAVEPLLGRECEFEQESVMGKIAGGRLLRLAAAPSPLFALPAKQSYLLLSSRPQRRPYTLLRTYRKKPFLLGPEFPEEKNGVTKCH